MSIVKQFGLTDKDKLDWILKAEGGELIINIKPIKIGEQTKTRGNNMPSGKSTNSHSENPKMIHELSVLLKKTEGEGFPQIVLMQSISDLIYVLKKIDKLIQLHAKGDFSSFNRKEALKLFRSTPLIRFYSQCLLLWGFRILEILEKTAGLEIPLDIRIARNILAAHYGISGGNLTKRLSRKEIILDNPKISPNGNLDYILVR